LPFLTLSRSPYPTVPENNSPFHKVFINYSLVADYLKANTFVITDQNVDTQFSKFRENVLGAITSAQIKFPSKVTNMLLRLLLYKYYYEHWMAKDFLNLAKQKNDLFSKLKKTGLLQEMYY